VSPDARWDVDLHSDIVDLLSDPRRAPGLSPQLRARLVHAIDLLEANGPRANGAKRLNDLDLYEIRVMDHRLFFDVVPGGRTIAATVFVRKARGTLPNRVYEGYEKRVRQHVETILGEQGHDRRRGGR